LNGTIDVKVKAGLYRQHGLPCMRPTAARRFPVAPEVLNGFLAEWVFLSPFSRQLLIF